LPRPVHRMVPAKRRAAGGSSDGTGPSLSVALELGRLRVALSELIERSQSLRVQETGQQYSRRKSIRRDQRFRAGRA
jgi:hypothetical protein